MSCLHSVDDGIGLQPDGERREPQNTFARQNEVVVAEQVGGELVGVLVRCPVDLHGPRAEVDIQISTPTSDDPQGLLPWPRNPGSTCEPYGIDLGKAFSTAGYVGDDLAQQSRMPNGARAPERSA